MKMFNFDDCFWKISEKCTNPVVTRYKDGNIHRKDWDLCVKCVGNVLGVNFCNEYQKEKGE